MLVHPWDAAVDDDEWRQWLRGRDFGQLVVNDPAGWPLVVPTHFVYDGAGEILVHLARPNPIWPLLDADPRATLAVLDGYAFVPTTWRAPDDGPVEHGVPTSYYASVQLACTATVIDDPAGKVDVLRRQLAHFQPSGDHGALSTDAGPYVRLLSGIRGLRLTVVGVTAKFKYDDHKPVALRERVAGQLARRGGPQDHIAAAEQRRRLTVTASANGGAPVAAGYGGIKRDRPG